MAYLLYYTFTISAYSAIKGGSMMEGTKAICQSCTMPMEKPEDFATEKDGSTNSDYCRYCYENGAFTGEMTMEQMIEVCVPYAVEASVYPTAEAARTAMQAFFPTLKRWNKK